MKCNYLILLFIFLISFLGFGYQGKGAFEIDLPNGASFVVFSLKDNHGLLDKYSANIKAPVCEDSICYHVNLIFNWNIIGEFLDYEIPPNEPLTKLDHINFLPEDYEKLQSILINQDLNFVKIPVNELVEKPDKPNVDGYSGATKLTIKKEVIPGALFSCYTLWHIANGAVIDSIKNHSSNALHKDLVSKLIKQKSQTINYFIINNLNRRGFEENIDAILRLLPESKGYFPKNAIEKIPEDLFALHSVQKYIIENYQKLDYYTQLAILKKLVNVKHTINLKQFLNAEITIKNSFQNQKLIALVIKNLDSVTFQKFVSNLEKNKIPVSEINHKAIVKLNETYHLNISNLMKK